MTNTSKLITFLLLVLGSALTVFGIGYINYYSILLDSGNVTIKGLANDPVLFGGMWIAIGAFFILIASIILVSSTDKFCAYVKGIFQGLIFGSLFTLIPGFLIFVIKRARRHKELNGGIKAMPYLLAIFVIVGIYILAKSIFALIINKKVEFEWPGTGVAEDKIEEYKERYRFQYNDAIERSENGLKLFIGIRRIIYGIFAIIIGFIGYSSILHNEQFPFYIKYILETCTIVIGLIFVFFGIKQIKR